MSVLKGQLILILGGHLSEDQAHWGSIVVSWQEAEERYRLQPLHPRTVPPIDRPGDNHQQHLRVQQEVSQNRPGHIQQAHYRVFGPRIRPEGRHRSPHRVPTRVGDRCCLASWDIGRTTGTQDAFEQGIDDSVYAVYGISGVIASTSAVIAL